MNYQTEICAFKTADNERLHGALLTAPKAQSDLALVLVHGVAMNFYLPPLFAFGQERICRGGNLTKFGGSAYENLEDCLADLDGALEFLKQRRYRRFVLIGH